jgi:hypothetical protein
VDLPFRRRGRICPPDVAEDQVEPDCVREAFDRVETEQAGADRANKQTQPSNDVNHEQPKND